jgi:hypothetical protein
MIILKMSSKKISARQENILILPKVNRRKKRRNKKGKGKGKKIRMTNRNKNSLENKRKK